MFGKLHPARLMEAKFTTKCQKDNDDKQKLCVVSLAYDFTPDVAEALGGAAPALQGMLANGGTEGMKVARAGVVLDVKDVGVKIKAADKEEISVDHTLQLKAKARQPAASSATPTLDVSASFAIEDDDVTLFLTNHLDQMCKVRLDKRQLDLPTAPEAEESEAE
jgi:hypothetical protein